MSAPTLDQRLSYQALPQGSAVMYQSWNDLLFLHWEIDPDIISARIPKRLNVDLHEGKAYVGVVPFKMNKVRPKFLPAVPFLSNFLELNVRTYVYDEHGRPGVWFFSLDCSQSIAVSIARSQFHLPYQNAQMSAKHSESGIDYRCRREGHLQAANYKWDPPTGGKVAEPGSLEFFLLERYLLFSCKPNGDLFSGRVHHEPYQFAPVSLEKTGKQPLDWEKISCSGSPVSALASPGVDVSVFPLKRVKRKR